MRRQLHALPLIALVATLLLLSGCGSSSRTKRSTSHIHIFSVNDMHAAMERMPRFAFIVDSLRAEYPELIVLSAGDNQSGSPFNDQYDPKGWPMIDLMNQIGFDASAMGNHEFDPSPANVAYYLDHAHFPFLCANVEAPAEYDIRPYTILRTKNGYRVGLVSLLFINELGIPDTHPDKVRDFTFLDPFTVAPDYLSLRDSVDALVYLTHLGYPVDKQLAETLPPEVVDLIIGGHSHTKVDREVVVHDILVTQALCKLQYCTLTDLTMGPDRRVIARSSHLIPIEEGGREQPAMRATVDAYFNSPRLHEPLATTEYALTKEQIGYLMADSFREIAGADIGLTNPGGIRRESLPAGSLSVMDVYNVDPFGNQLVTVELTAAELLQLFESGYDKLDARRPIVPSGLHVVYALHEDGSLEGITLTDPEGNALDPDRTYRLALSSYAASVYSYGDKSRIVDRGETTAEATIDYLRRHKVVPDYTDEQRITIFNVGY